MFSLHDVFYAVSIFIRILRIAIIVYAVMSWGRPNFRFFYMLESFVRPFLIPFRRLSLWVMTKLRRPLDFSCWFALIGLSIINNLWWRLYYLLYFNIR